MSASLTTWGIASRNVQRKPGRSFCLILTVLLFSFFLFAGSVFSVSLAGGAESAANRLGADVMIVPEGYDPHIDSILLSGKPSTFTLPEDTLELLGGLEADIGIDRLSPQAFLATLRASCCSYPVQLVGIDYDTDFIVKPWMENTLRRRLKDGEVIVGCHVSGWPGDTLTFFGKDLPVAGRLEQTGMGFDATVFMTRPTLAALAKEAERVAGRTLGKDSGFISVVMMKLKPGYDSVAAAQEINRVLNSRGIYALFSKKFVNSISRSLTWISRFTLGGLCFTWLLAFAVIALLFALSLAERKREMGALRAIGASRGKLIRLALVEAFLTGAYGAVLGVVLGAVAVLALSPLAVEALHLPFLLPSLPSLAMLGLVSGLAAVLTGVLAAAFPAWRAGRADIHEALS